MGHTLVAPGARRKMAILGRCCYLLVFLVFILSQASGFVVEENSEENFVVEENPQEQRHHGWNCSGGKLHVRRLGHCWFWDRSTMSRADRGVLGADHRHDRCPVLPALRRLCLFEPLPMSNRNKCESFKKK